MKSEFWCMVFSLFLAVAMTGCATIYPAPQEPVCARPEAVDSVICATAQRLNMTAEQIDAMFLDATALGVGTKIASARELRAALVTMREWVAGRDILNIQGITNYLMQQAKLDPAVSILLSRRLGLINLPILGLAPLTKYDIELVLAGIDHQLEQLAWF